MELVNVGLSHFQVTSVHLEILRVNWPKIQLWHEGLFVQIMLLIEVAVIPNELDDHLESLWVAVDEDTTVQNLQLVATRK